MRRRLAGHSLGVLLCALYLGILAAVAVQHGFIDDIAHKVEGVKQEARRQERGRGGERSTSSRRGTRQRDRGPVERTVDRASAAAWRALGPPLLLLLLLASTSLISRAAHRRRRLARTRRFEVRLGREDEASPFKREKLFDAWHGQLSARWWRRLYAGQSSFALEIHQGHDRTQRLALAGDAEDARVLEGRLTETYPDVRLVELPGTPTWAGRIVRLKKRRPFIDRLQTLKDDEQTLCESLVSTMARVGEPATVQLMLTPGPELLHRLSRVLLKRRERELTRTEHERRHDIGVDSVVEDKELKGALETQHRSLFFCELRVASDSREAVKALAGVFSEARAENALARREVGLRRTLYAKRLRVSAANPLPSWWRGVLSSSELGALWALPRQRAKGARLVRSPVRRASAPPEVCREPDLALMRDEHGPVGLWPEDRKYGLALIGGQGTGKTSAMARTIAIDAGDREAALIVLDPKHDLAEHALSLVSEDRAVWYMDLARPEVGIDPLGVNAEPGVVADMLVAALREAHPDGSIMAASDRFLRHAAMAVCAVEERPTLWHMLELLSPRREDYRERVTERLAGQPKHAALLRYWGTSFPELWQDATRGQLGMALDAPRNKLERLITTVEVDKALRHPFALDLRKVIQKGEVLIVNGSLGEVGQDNAVTVMQLVLQLLHQALKQQQLLPPEERPRVCLKVDEAHLVLTPSFAELLALHRAAGLEVVAAWQYNAQLQNPVIRSGLRSLLRSVSMFAMGEVRDARDQAEVAMEVYTDSIKSEREDLERLRVSPDDVVRLPVHTAVNSWVATGARRSAFVAGTFALQEAARAGSERRLARQREAGAVWPDELPPPAEVAPALLVKESPTSDEEGDSRDSAKVGSGGGGRPPAANHSGGVRRKRTEPGAQRSSQPEPPGGLIEAGTPPSYRAVHRDDLTGLVFDRTAADAELARSLEPSARDLEILRALWRYGLLLTSQIAAEWWPDNDPSAAQRRLTRLARAGWLQRLRPTVVAGNHEWIYRLAPAGLRLAQQRTGPDGPYIPPSARFVERTPADHHSLLHDLQVNAWVLTYKRLAGPLLHDWLGPEECRLEVPLKPGRPRPEQIGPRDLALPGYVQVRGLGLRRFARVAPDAALSMELQDGRRFELLVELDRTRRPNRSESKLLRYDALVTAWWRALPRYQELGEPPVAVFVCQHEQDAFALMRAAERQVKGSLANPGEPTDRFRYPGRERMLFVAEHDVHAGSARAFMLSRRPGRRVGENGGGRDVQLPRSGAGATPAAGQAR